MTETTIDFNRSFLRFYLDFEGRQAISLSHRPPTRTNRTRINLEAVCRLTQRSTGKITSYVLSAACKTEQVGAAAGNLWIQPNADCIFILGDDGEFAVYKSWSRCDPGVMLEPASLGMQPERQTFHVDDNFNECRYELRESPGVVLETYDMIAAAILGDRPLVSRIEYADGEYDIRIDQPVKTINLAERDRLFQTDTGPIIVPDLRPQRRQSETHFVGIFDLAYSAFHAADWAEVVLRRPTQVVDDVMVNHYSETRLLRSTRNTLLQLST